MQLLIGTSKGLVVFQRADSTPRAVSSGTSTWQVAAIHFRGFPVSMVFVDERTGNWWVGLSHQHWGQKLHRSTDQGETWENIAVPNYPDQKTTLKKIWCMASTGKPEGLWLGTEPGGFFHSQDGGQSFHLVESLWNHPCRQDPAQWFGTGRNLPFIHSIVVDPRNSDHVYLAVSCAGVFETRDGGRSWVPKNKGLKATYLPNPNVKIGHDPHLLLACGQNPDVLWQQNHCGIFRTENGGEIWEDVTDPTGLADYGFALAVDDENPLRAWVVPATSDVERIAPNLALCVCRTEDGGKSWQAQRSGLPQANCFDIVFRHSLVRKNGVMAFGTTTGNVYLSENDGEEWICLSNNLARIDYLAASG